MKPYRSILLTGASGSIGEAVRAPLRRLADKVRLADLSTVEPLDTAEEMVVTDVRDLDQVRSAVANVDAVVHLAGIPNEASFDDILMTNMVGTYNVFEAARLEGVRRVIYASSNHVVGFYPRGVKITPNDPVRPDSYYAVSKVFGEALGSLYHDKWGLEVVCLRIGSFRGTPGGVRQLSTWLSPEDAARLFERCLEAPHVGFLVFFGTSDNDESWWTNDVLANALLHYEPLDKPNADGMRLDDGHGDRSEEGRAAELQGGEFTLPDYSGRTP